MVNKKILETVWKNIEYYTQIRGLYKQDVYRTDRVGKGISLDTLAEIAETLDIPVILLFESEEDKEISRDVAWDIVCAELKLTPSELINLKSLVKGIEKLLEKSGR